MNQRFAWKFALVAAMGVLAVWSFYHYGIQLGLDLEGGTSFRLKMDLSQIDSTGRGQAMKQAIEIIRKRIDRFGVAEPIIQSEGDDRILVQIPGLEQKFREQARRILERTAYLEFRLVHRDNDRLVAESETDPSFAVPVGYQRLVEEEKTRDGRKIQLVYFVRVKPEMTGKYVERAYWQPDELGRPYVLLEFDSDGGKLFDRTTAANVGRNLAIVLDGDLYSAPVINERISGGRAQITGTFSMSEAQQLANILENPLEAPVQIVEERGVDPSLGRDSIRSGVRAAAIAAVLIVVFMVAYYLLAGVVASLALALNFVLLIGVLSAFKFTLTLPGIAGIVLTVGMAVDASVLIYERIREELAANKTLRAAIAAGYQRAFIVIFDSNFTTIITAGILMYLGSGPVKGFGVTLTIGLLANLFAAVFVTRLVFDWLVDKGWLTAVRMLHLVRPTHINFMGVWKIAFILSWFLIATGVASFVTRGGHHVGRGEVYGIDFSGGDAVTLGFARKVEAPQIRQCLEQSGITDAFIQYQRSLMGEAEVLSLKLGKDIGEPAVSALQTSFPDAQFTVSSSESVWAVIGAELLQQALYAVLAAMVVIMIYIAFRFGEFAYGLGALIALCHDILMTVAWFCLTGRTFSLPVVAALLAVIGYSINDTIIVFDRVRENRKLGSGRLDYSVLLNSSINQTLPRTVLTAGTTLLTAMVLYVFGGRVINDFAFTFMVGILTGTYSSIYIASPVILWWHRQERPRAKPARV
ncbi:protein translocase subunit SecD [bacterium]|nr:protein translocase subunit SecD [bacterium]